MEEKEERKTKKKWWKKVIFILFLLFLVGIFYVFGINSYVKNSVKGKILEENSIDTIPQVDCILVLGAGVWESGPSPMLRDRLEKGIELYQQGVAPKLLMSGDHGRKDYDEVNAMKEYAIEQGVPSQDIFMDHAGFSTYESIYRAKEIFQVKTMIIVTQEYHLYRALYIAKKLGIEVYGVPAQKIVYSGQTARELREILARNKDFINCMIKPKPTYLGESIPVSGNGDQTNDKVEGDAGL